MTTEPIPTIGSEEDFEAFGPRLMESGDFWQFRDLPADVPLERVWSLLETGTANCSLIASPGYHVVNVSGYVITDTPWTDQTQDYYWYEDDRETYVALLDDGEVIEEVGYDEADAIERIESGNDDAKVVRIALEADWVDEEDE